MPGHISARSFAIGALLALGMGVGNVAADTGDILSVTGEEVNLRSGPSDESNIRSTVTRGTELIELQREGNWIGVRVQDTGQEGWIYSELVQRVAASSLDIGQENPFTRISPDFAGLLDRIGDEAGYRLFEEVRQPEADRLSVTPTREWMDRSGADMKMMTGLAIYEMWKNYNDGRPVDVEMVDPQGNALLGITDGAQGPDITLDQAIAGQ
ncbi:MAG TPA: SH3 domain-containing protein [Arenibaculum sp.]|nr:SH3 domain-containing protein [Arenibaculum sp.]